MTATLNVLTQDEKTVARTHTLIGGRFIPNRILQAVVDDAARALVEPHSRRGMSRPFDHLSPDLKNLWREDARAVVHEVIRSLTREAIIPAS